MENMYIPGYLKAASIFKKENMIYEEIKSITNPSEEIICEISACKLKKTKQSNIITITIKPLQ